MARTASVESTVICGKFVGGIKCTGIVKPLKKKGGKDPAKCTKCGHTFTSYTRLKWLRAKAEKEQTDGVDVLPIGENVDIQFDSADALNLSPEVDAGGDMPFAFDKLPETDDSLGFVFDTLPAEVGALENIETNDGSDGEESVTKFDASFAPESEFSEVGETQFEFDPLPDVDIVYQDEIATDYNKKPDELSAGITFALDDSGEVDSEVDSEQEDFGIYDPMKPVKTMTLHQLRAARQKQAEREDVLLRMEQAVSVEEYEPLGDESLVVEMVYEETPEIVVVADDLAGLWSDEADEFGHTLDSVRKLLDVEAARLTAENFVLGGVDFNTGKLSAEEALKDIRVSSISALMNIGKPHTQVKIEEIRAGEALAAAEEARREDVLRSEHAQHRLSYQFALGMMTDEQSDEFRDSGVLTKTQLRLVPPTPEQLHKTVNAERFAKNLPYQLKVNYSIETVETFVDIWKGICAEIRNDEFGRKSYWVAAETNWATGSYEAEVIKTAFASGLSVTPPVALTHLVAVFEKSNNYLNDLEFIYNSPKNMRDTIESFNYFNKAYKAVHEGAVSEFTPKPIPPYMFTWRAYTSSDVVIVRVPAIGIATGGIGVLTDLLAIRAAAGLATIIVSTKSIRQLNELNSNFLLEFFSNTGCSLVSFGEAAHIDEWDVNNYAYFSTDGDASTRGSAIQRKNRNVEQRTERRGGNVGATSAAKKTKKTKKTNKTPKKQE